MSQSSYVYCDNQSVLRNVTVPASMLKKKSQSIAYHFIREGVARLEWLVSYVQSDENTSNTLTKSVVGEKRKVLVADYMYDIYDNI